MKRWSGRNLRFVVDPVSDTVCRICAAETFSVSFVTRDISCGFQFPPFNMLYSDAETGELRAYGTFASLIGNVTAAMNMT